MPQNETPVDDLINVFSRLTTELKERAKPIKIEGPNLLTQKLGLSAYANSDSEEEEDGEEPDNGKDSADSESAASSSEADSEEELKVSLL